jgi:hypothetical protein
VPPWVAFDDDRVPPPASAPSPSTPSGIWENRGPLRDPRPALDVARLVPVRASSLLNDVLMQIEFQRTGRYQDPDHFTLD